MGKGPTKKKGKDEVTKVIKTIVFKASGQRCSFTPRNEFVLESKYKGRTFLETKEDFFALWRESCGLPTTKSLEKHVKKPKFLQAEIDDDCEEAKCAWEELLAMYTDPSQARWCKRLHESKLNLLNCTPHDLLKVLSPIVEESVTKISYVKKMSTDIRNMFRGIGRQYEWDNDLFVYKDRDRGDAHFMHRGCPMTPGIQDKLVEILNKKEKSLGISTTSQHHNPPVPAPMAVYLILAMLNYLIECFGKPNSSVERVHNPIQLIMTYVLFLHEGGVRAVETFDYMTFENIYLNLHVDVPLIALVFLKPSTLQHIIINNLLQYYTLKTFKGKQKHGYVSRQKEVIPYEYNVIDLVTMFTLCQKVLFFFKRGFLEGDKYFKSSAETLRSFHKDRMKAFKISNLTFYSFRYMTAMEEENENIPANWTTQRMGHVDGSKTKDRYAKEDKRRVAYDGKQLQSSVDRKFERPKIYCKITKDYKTTSNSNTGFKNDPDFLKKLPHDAMRTDFEDTIRDVSQYLNNPKRETFKRLKKRFFENHHTLEDLKIPLGFNICLPDKLIVGDMAEAFEQFQKNVIATFCYTSNNVLVKRPVVPIWSFPYIIYGNWRPLLDDDVKADLFDDQFEEVTYTNDRDYDMDSEDEDYMEEDESEYGLGWDLSRIKPDWTIVVIAGSKDKSTFNVDGVNIWCGSFITWKHYDKKSTELSLCARFYYNNKKDITKEWVLNVQEEWVQIKYNDVLLISAKQYDAKNTEVCRILNENIIEYVTKYKCLHV